ncbi:MAG: 50S ribosomal protein L3 N(5)-glutamine methyltransferase [Pseudohongiellaceae bacterium]
MKIVEFLETLAERMQQAGVFFGHGTDNAWDDAVYLVLASLDIPFDCPEHDLVRELTEAELNLLEERAIQRIDERLPTAYVVGKSWFAGHCFLSDARALVPRSPIAELITEHFQPLLGSEPGAILDLCAGGGCIGIASALAFPESRVDLADISEAALQLASENIRLHGVEKRVKTVQSDLFANLDGPYDLIVCNPPYVSAEEICELPAEYVAEPLAGLYSRDKGLALPLQILREAADVLAPGGMLVLEVGYSREALEHRLPSVPLLWLEFERGGGGVVAMSAAELERYRDSFN